MRGLVYGYTPIAGRKTVREIHTGLKHANTVPSAQPLIRAVQADVERIDGANRLDCARR